MKVDREWYGVSVTALALVLAHPASAQQTTSAEVPQESGARDAAVAENESQARGDADSDREVLVTGTRIRRTDVSTATPITVIDKEMITQRGLGRLDETLSAIPQIAPMLGERGSNDPRLGPARINLRKLGAGRTLNLLNGERMTNDVNIIPSALIERVDVLTGGASAVYGSDAIAGVVNFIVKRRFQGIELNAEASTQQSTNDNDTMLNLLDEAGYPRPDRNVWGGQQYFASLTAGTNFADNRGNISLFGSYRRTEPMEFSAFDHTACPLYMNPQNPLPAVQQNDQWACGYTEYNPYNWFYAGGQEWTNATDGSRNWRPYDVADIVRNPQKDYLQRSTRTYNAGGFASFDFSDALKFDANFLYTRYKQHGRNAQAVGFYAPDFQMPCDNPFMSQQQATIVCGANAGVAGETGTFSMTVFRPDYANDYYNDISDWRGAAHLSGKITDEISFDLSGQKSRRIEKYEGTNIFDYWVMVDRFTKAMQVVNSNGKPTCTSVIDGSDPACVPLDAFSTAGPDAAVWDYVTRTGGSRVQIDQMVLNGSVSGTLGALGLKSPFADSALGFAIVAEHRWNRVSESGSGAYDWWSRYASSDVVDELGGELELPLIQNKPFIQELTVSGAYRLSDYRSLDSMVHTWKADFTYRPFNGLGFRGSLNKALRQGVLERLQTANPYNGTFRDFCAPPGPGSTLTRYTFEQCAASGLTQAQYDALGNYNGCDTNGLCQVLYRPGGNPELQPEKSRSVTLGVVAQPRFLRGLTASFDYFAIKITGAFEWIRTDLVADQCYNQKVSFYCGLITRDPATGAVTEINARYMNSGFVETKGYDFALSYNWANPSQLIGMNIGSLNFGINGTINTTYNRQFAPNSPVYSCLGYFGFFCTEPSPKYRHYASIGWGMPWKGNINLLWRYASSTRNSKLAPNAPLAARPSPSNTDNYPLIAKMPALSLFDLAVSYPISRAVDIRFNVQNLFDKDPPMVGNADAGTGSWFNTYPQYDSWGRTLRLGIRARIW
ncbi:TonB-dependent receptor domain-containing protein [Sphingomonas gei]|nr:TonB-dependent receptor [Sphingomonas gei]